MPAQSRWQSSVRWNVDPVAQLAAITVEPVPADIPGSAAANEILVEFHHGMLARSALMRWIEELRTHGFADLAAAVAVRV